MSENFHVSNGVRQGSLLSPHLFSLYVDDLSALLNASEVGCFIDGSCTNHLFYADDLCLLAPSAVALQDLLDICFQYGQDHDITFNHLKSQYMVFKRRTCTLTLPDVHLDTMMLPRVTNAKYLGVLMNDEMNDEMEMKKQYSRLYARCNTILRKFRNCSVEVKKTLFTAYCTNFYCIPLWCKFTQGTFMKVKVAYNNVFRSLFNYDRRASVSQMFVTNNVFNFDSIYRKCVYDFKSRVLKSQNCILLALTRNFYVASNELFSRWQRALYTCFIDVS